MSDTLDNILHKLPTAPLSDKGAMRVLTIRLPAELHAALQEEARQRQTSINRIATAKLALKATVLDHVVEAMAAMEKTKCAAPAASS